MSEYENSINSSYNRYSYQNFQNKSNNYNKNPYSNLKMESYNTINDDYKSNKIINYNNGYTITEANRNMNSIDSLSNRYFSKIVIDNIRQPEIIINMLDNYLTEKNLPKNYDTDLDKRKLTLLFYDEGIAFNFTKYLNSLKNQSSTYNDMEVHLSLAPNQDYLKNERKNKRRGLSLDSIERLFNGIGVKKKFIKHKKKDLDFFESSPFEHEVKQNKIFTIKNLKSRNEGLKDFNKYRQCSIRVLDTDYTSLRPFIFRDMSKEKWICPSNFKI